MAPLIGFTLGEKHRSYNTLLKETLAKRSADLPRINYDDNDIDNMMRIDIACAERNVDYIINVFKCDDMLYVTRAIKRSSWLITEQEYAHLINPEYLHSNLFPEMIPKAITKFLLHIRRHLKDERRAESFFAYVDKTNPDMAMKWLEICSLKFTEEIVKSRASSITPGNLRRLCKKSIRILDVYTASHDSYCIPLQNTTFLLKSHTEEFLNITEPLNDWKFTLPTFNEKATQFLLKRCFQRIVDNYSKYQNRIHLSTFVKYLKRNDTDIESFLLFKIEGFWFQDMKPFLNELSQERVLELLIKKHGSIHASDTRTEAEELFHAIEPNNRTFSNVYQWYEFAPYDKAFKDLQKFIYAESSPEERHSMLIVLLKSARKNMKLVRSVLQYYHDKHINEPYMHKIKFVNSVLTLHDAFLFDDTTWNILNKLFHSLEVYIPSTKKVQLCLKTIISHNILHDQPVSEVVKQKFTFDTFKDIQRQINRKEQDKLFDYLYNQLIEKLRDQDMNRETGMQQATVLTENIWLLIKDWNKEKTHHPFVIDSMIKISNLNKKFKWLIDMRSLYCSVKPYHRRLFENSLLLYPCEEMCIHALKHDPGLLVRYEDEVGTLRCDDRVSLRRLLSKLRIYWRESLASKWRNTFLFSLPNVVGHKAKVRGIFVLSPQMQLLEFVKMYTPSEHKIKWSEANEIEVSLQKHIAKNLHLARPQLQTEVVLWFAKGDYLQHALISVNAIYTNLRSKDIQKHIQTLLCAPVSLQKHGIRLARKRMKIEELLQIFLSIWKSTRNSSIRNMLFQSVFEFMSKAKDNLIEDVWKVLSSMIEDLNYKENILSIYATLVHVSVVPLSIISEYYKKTFVFIRDFPKKYNMEYYFEIVLGYVTDIVQYLDSQFVENTILFPVYGIFSKKNDTLRGIFSAYLLCSKDENIQMLKCKNLFGPLFEICIPKWKNKEFDSDVVAGFQDTLKRIGNDLPRFVFEMRMVMPVKMLATIQHVLKTELCANEFYGLITHWKLSVAYIKLLNDMMNRKQDKYYNWENIHEKAVTKYAKICVEYLKEDIVNFFPSIYVLFADALKGACNDFGIKSVNFITLLNRMLIKQDDLQVYMLVLQILPKNSWEDKAKKKIDGICKKIYCYPSKELRMHYYTRYSYEYQINECEYDQEENSESDSERENEKSNLARIEKGSSDDKVMVKA